jgi:protease-4
MLKSALRSFLVSTFTIVGLCFGFLLAGSMVEVASSTASQQTTAKNSTEVLSNPDGSRKTLASDTPLILMLSVDGVIGVDKLTTDRMRTLLEETQGTLFDEGRVKGIVIRLNTPGGTVADSAGIYQELQRYKEKYQVPILAYVDGMCASGGMYIAAAADQVYASDISLIGSVGTIMNSFVNVSEALERFGVKTRTLSAGKFKDAMNPLRPWREGEEDWMQEITNYYYIHFVELLTSNRPRLDKEKLVYEYGARVFPAAEAAEYGYIDKTGSTIGQVIQQLAETQGIADKKFQVVGIQPRRWYSDLFEAKFSLLSGTMRHEVAIPGIDTQLNGQFLYLYRP